MRKLDDDGSFLHDAQDIPWDALGKVLNKQHLKCDEEGNVLRIVDKSEFMYMGSNYSCSEGKVDRFKHHVTRNYVYMIDQNRLHVREDGSFNRGYFGSPPAKNDNPKGVR